MAALRSYRLVSLLVGALLVTAGLLKLVELAERLPYSPDRLSLVEKWSVRFQGDRHIALGDRWVGSLLAGAEVLFGVWLVAGLFPRWSRIAVVAVVLVLLNAAVALAVGGAKLCGCFGRVETNPWIAVALDTAALAALLVSRRPAHEVKSVGWRWTLVVLGFAGIAGAVFGINRSGEPGPNSVGVASAPDDQESLIEEIIRDIDKNRQGYTTLQFEVEQIQLNHWVKTHPQPEPPRKEGWPSMATPPETRLHRRFWVSPDAVRCDTKRTLPPMPTGGTDLIEVATRESSLRYQPKMKRASIDKPLVLPTKDTPQIDLTTWAFTQTKSAPLMNARDWFDNLIIKSAMRTESNGVSGIRVEAVTGPKSRLKYQISIFFAREQSHMPIWMEVRKEEKWLLSRGELHFVQLPARKSWVPQRAYVKLWPQGAATNSNDSGLANELTVRVISTYRVDEPIPPEQFDPPIPAGVLLSDSLMTFRTLELPKTAPATSRVQDQIVPAPEPPPRPRPQIPVFALALLNVSVLVPLVVFRRWLAL